MNLRQLVVERESGLHNVLTRKLAVEILRAETNGVTVCLGTEGKLARHLKVSRTATREAIKVLAAKGLLEVRPKVGIRVKPSSAWNVLDPDLLVWQCEAGLTDLFIRNLYELRMCIESMAARRAAERSGEGDVAVIARWYERMEMDVGSSDPYSRADAEFHAAIFRACHNNLLAKFNDTLVGALRALWRLPKVYGSDTPRALGLHKKVLDAISERNGEKAQTAMEELVGHAVRTLYPLLKQEIKGLATASMRGNWDVRRAPRYEEKAKGS